MSIREYLEVWIDGVHDCHCLRWQSRISPMKCECYSLDIICPKNADRYLSSGHLEVLIRECTFSLQIMTSSAAHPAAPHPKCTFTLTAITCVIWVSVISVCWTCSRSDGHNARRSRTSLVIDTALCLPAASEWRILVIAPKHESTFWTIAVAWNQSNSDRVFQS